MRAVILLTAAVASAAAAVLAQQERPTFRAGVATVPIYATVRNADGALVPDLTREDFEIKDNGVKRDVVVFSREIVPITVVVLLDMSGSQEEGVNWMRDAGYAFVDALLPDDRARIGTFGIEIAMSPRLTRDKTYLRRVLSEEVWPGGGTPLWRAVDRAMTSLDHESGRRVILALTDGFDTAGRSTTTSFSALPAASGERWSTRTPIGDYAKVLGRASREDFMVYAVARVQTAAVRQIFAHLGNSGDLSDEMRALVLESGGGYHVFERRQDAATAMAAVIDELHHQYALGFAPAALDGKVHKVEVTTRRAGMTVRARKSYLAEQ